MKQAARDIEIRNKNLKKRDETTEESRDPSVQDKMKEFQKNVVDKKYKDMKTDNTFNAQKQPFLPNGVHTNADNTKYKPYSKYDENRQS